MKEHKEGKGRLMTRYGTLLMVLPAVLAFSGCATKGYVNDRLDERITAQDNRIDELNRTTADLKNTTADAMQRAESASASATEARDLALGKVGLKETASHTVYFAFDSDRLSGEAKAELDQAAREVQNQPEAIVDIYGFTDKVGPDNYNYDLGQRRAMRVLRYLADRTPGQLSRYAAVSYGEERKTAMEMENAKERRVTISILKRIPLSEATHAEVVKDR